MIVSHARRYVFIGIPKCASTSVRELLLDRCDGLQVAHDHACRVPNECAGYSVFTVVRDPYARYFSLYGYIARHAEHRCHKLARRLGVIGFARWLATPGAPPRIAPSEYELACGVDAAGFDGRDGCQWEFVKHLPAVRILRYETLVEDLRGLEFVGLEAYALPRLNEAPAADWGRVWCAELERSIARWAAADFEHLGYRRRAGFHVET